MIEMAFTSSRVLVRSYRNIQTTFVPCMSASTSKKIDLSGVFTPIATAFNTDETIAYDKLAQNFTKWNSTNLSGYLVQGSNGEFIFMTPEERVDLIKRTRELIPSNKLLLAGAGAEGTKNSIVLGEEMAKAGADALVHVTPCYYKSAINDRTLINHFEEVADKSPLPVILYSVPANTGIDLSVNAVKVLSQHPNIIGMKDSAGDVTKLASLVSGTKNEDFQVMAGSAGYLLAALHVGCTGGVCALGNVLPEQLCKLYEGFLKDPKSADLLSHQYSLIAPNSAVTKQYGVSGMKQAMEFLGYYGGPVRKPLLPLLSDEKETLKKIFEPFM